MWLAASAEGVAMGWVSMYRREDVREVLGIPDHVNPVALLTVGFTPYFPEIPVWNVWAGGNAWTWRLWSMKSSGMSLYGNSGRGRLPYRRKMPV